mmetsp:Transcript_110516/g.319373  ORF Transcript_110516/g.319373 Transcript_110516/m.319373 type:complete len:387 (-) Transcript_110516:17-1177(-)
MDQGGHHSQPQTLLVHDGVANGVVEHPKGAARGDQLPHTLVVHRLLQVTHVQCQRRLHAERHASLALLPIAVEVVLLPQPVILHDPDFGRIHPLLNAILQGGNHEGDGSQHSEAHRHPRVRLICRRGSVGMIEPAQRHRPHLLRLVRHHDRSVRHRYERNLRARDAATRLLQLLCDRSAQDVLSGDVLLLDSGPRQASIVAGDLDCEFQCLPTEEVERVRVRLQGRLLFQFLAFVVPDGLHVNFAGWTEPVDLVLRHPQKRGQTRIVARFLADQLRLCRAQVDRKNQLAQRGIVGRQPTPSLEHRKACAPEHCPEDQEPHDGDHFAHGVAHLQVLFHHRNAIEHLRAQISLDQRLGLGLGRALHLHHILAGTAVAPLHRYCFGHLP